MSSDYLTCDNTSMCLRLPFADIQVGLQTFVGPLRRQALHFKASRALKRMLEVGEVQRRSADRPYRQVRVLLNI